MWGEGAGRGGGLYWKSFIGGVPSKMSFVQEAFIT